MSAHATGSKSKILVCGYDATLLATRRFLLLQAGFQVDSAASRQELELRIANAEPPYKLIVVGHTVPLVERLRIERAAAKSQMPVYQLETAIAPESFLVRVFELVSNR
jgi:DNA-binding response OmpR family regulator